MEIAMTDKSVLMWMYDLLGCGTLMKKDIRLHTQPVGKNNGVGDVNAEMHIMSVY